MGAQSLSALDAAMGQMQATISQFVEQNESSSDSTDKSASSGQATQNNLPVDMMAFMVDSYRLRKKMFNRQLAPSKSPTRGAKYQWDDRHDAVVRTLGSRRDSFSRARNGNAQRLFGLPIAREVFCSVS